MQTALAAIINRAIGLRYGARRHGRTALEKAPAVLNCDGMKTLQSPSKTAGFLAQLLERLDASRVPVDAHQYRTVVDSLTRMLSDDSVDWQPLLAESPAAAAVYENLHYAEAGLCRSPLEM